MKSDKTPRYILIEVLVLIALLLTDAYLVPLKQNKEVVKSLNNIPYRSGRPLTLRHDYYVTTNKQPYTTTAGFCNAAAVGDTVIIYRSALSNVPLKIAHSDGSRYFTYNLGNIRAGANFVYLIVLALGTSLALAVFNAYKKRSHKWVIASTALLLVVYFYYIHFS